MGSIQRQIRVARRRLTKQQFAERFASCLFVCLMVASLAVGLPKFVPLRIDPWQWAAGWTVAAIGIALVASLIWTYATRWSASDAAVEIDRRYGLQERVASSLGLSAAERKSPFGRALIADAERCVGRIDVREQFRRRFRWLYVRPLIPSSIILAFVFVGPAVVDDQAGATPAGLTASSQPVRHATRQLPRQLAKAKQLAKELGLSDTRQRIETLEKGVEQLAKAANVDRAEGLATLNDLSQTLLRHRAGIGSRNDLLKHLQSLGKLQRGPADQLARAMKAGDFRRASRELEQLQQRLLNDSISSRQQERLAGQMAGMAEQLRQVLAAHDEAKNALQREGQRLRKREEMAAAGELQRQLERLNIQGQRLARLEQLASALERCADFATAVPRKGARQAEGLQPNATRDAAHTAAAAWDELTVKLQRMRADMIEVEILEEVLAGLGQAKDAIACVACDGMGCETCQGSGQGAGLRQGLGMGPGQGDRPEQETTTEFFDAPVDGNIGSGKALVVDSIPGPNNRGDVREQVKAALEAARHSVDDPVSGQRIPNSHRTQVEQYFKAFRLPTSSIRLLQPWRDRESEL